MVRQEDTRAADGRVEILVEPEPREHIRDAGEDLEPGDTVLRRGDRVGWAHVGVLASHIGMGYNPSVLFAIADRLLQTPETWEPFDMSGLRKLFYHS